VEGALDSAHGACHLDIHRISRAAGHREAVRLRKLKDSIEIFLAGAEAFGELCRRDVLTITGAGRVIDILQEIQQLRMMTEGQNDIEAHGL
jgi:hypothetical protein